MKKILLLIFLVILVLGCEQENLEPPLDLAGEVFYSGESSTVNRLAEGVSLSAGWNAILWPVRSNEVSVKQGLWSIESSYLYVYEFGTEKYYFNEEGKYFQDNIYYKNGEKSFDTLKPGNLYGIRMESGGVLKYGNKSTEILCLDSDESDHFIAGYVRIPKDIRKDYCANERAVREYYCDDPYDESSVRSEIYLCPVGYHCLDGACISAILDEAIVSTITYSDILEDDQQGSSDESGYSGDSDQTDDVIDDNVAPVNTTSQEVVPVKPIDPNVPETVVELVEDTPENTVEPGGVIGPDFELEPDTILEYPLNGQKGEKHYNILMILVNTISDEIVFDEPKAGHKTYFTPQELGDIFFNNPEGVNSALKDISYGKVSLSGTVIGWFNLGAQDKSIDDIRLGKDYYASLASDYVVFSDYDIIYLVAKTKGRGGGIGWGLNNFINTPQGMFRVGIDYMVNSEFSVEADSSYLSSVLLPSSSWLHELLHTLGISGHSQSLNCGEEIISSSCELRAYGGVYSVMGEFAFGIHPDVRMKSFIGWLEPEQITEVVENGEYVIYPLETSDENVKGLKINLPETLEIVNNKLDKKVYFDKLYIEYRQPIGFDRYLERLDGSSFFRRFKPEGDVDREGVIIYLSHKGNTVASTALLDMHPETSYSMASIKYPGNPGKFSDSILAIGESFSVSGVTITPLGNVDGGIKVRVEFG